MKKHCYLFIVLFTIVTDNYAQWSNQYKTGNTTIFQNVIVTTDKHLVLVGDYTKNAFAPNIITVAKTTLDGDIIWTKKFGKNIQQNGFYAVETADGGYVIGGIELKINPATFEPAATICIFKLTANGDLLWSHYLQYGNQKNIVANALIATADGGVLLGGSFTQLTPAGLYTYNYLAKINSGGIISWSKQFDAPGYRRWITALVEVNGGYAVVSESFTGTIINQADAVNVSLLNDTGKVMKSVQVSITGGPVHFIQTACATADGGIAIAGTTGTGPGNFDLWLLKINKQLEVAWSNTIDINRDDRPNKITQLANGSLLVTGAAYDSTGKDKPVVIELDKKGKLQQAKLFPADNYRFANGAAIKGKITYLLVNDEFGIGSGYPVLYCFTDINTICNTSNITVNQKTANDLIISNRIPGTARVATAVSNMPYTLTDLNLTKTALCNVLPLNLLTFTAQPAGNKNELQWTTAGEENTASFTIERYNNGKYAAIGTVAAQHNSLSNSYRFTDARPLAGVNMYRLKMMSTDSAFTYSFVATAVYGNSAIAVTVSPNPAPDHILLKLRLARPEAVQYTIVNESGVHMLSKSFTPAVQLLDEQINITNFAAGVYFIRVTAGTQHYTLRFVKK